MIGSIKDVVFEPGKIIYNISITVNDSDGPKEIKVPVVRNMIDHSIKVEGKGLHPTLISFAKDFVREHIASQYRPGN